MFLGVDIIEVLEVFWTLKLQDGGVLSALGKYAIKEKNNLMITFPVVS